MKFQTIILLCVSTMSLAQANVLTKANDNTRSGLYQETKLTPASVRAKGLRLLSTIPVVGDAIGMEAQPLIMHGVSIPGGSVHDIMVLPSEANIIRGVNAEDGTSIWQTGQLCVPVNSDRNNPSSNDMWHVNDHFGMMATGVIDPSTFKFYQSATCSSDGSGSQASVTQRMFVLDIRTGGVLANTLFTGTSNGLNYATAPRKQRSSLALWNVSGTKFILGLSGSFAETGDNASGFLWAFDTFDNQFKAMLATRAGGWMSGQGLSIDKDGTIYFGLGNGPFNGVTTFGEAVLQVRLNLPTATTAATFTVLHAWAPFSDASRTCANPTLTQPTKSLGTTLAGMSAPSVVPGATMPMDTGRPCDKKWGDQDANLFGKLLPDVHKYLSGGKDGVAFMTDTLDFPSTQPADFAKPKTNCAKAGMFQPAWDLGMDSCPTKLSELNRFPGGKSRHIHSTPATYIAVDGTHYELFWSENSPLQANKVKADGSLTFVARSNEMASALSTTGTGGMPGGFCGATTGGLLFCSVPDGDANRTVTTGRMLVYDLTNLAGLEGTANPIPLIWTSQQYVYNKFMAPVIWNGEVYLPNYNGSVMVFTQ
ncbi:MAG: hypothetical protein JWQ42_5110 [Edaphobacter sp.]|nr:hypothetical protein [Edaphobacter sp.]